MVKELGVKFLAATLILMLMNVALFAQETTQIMFQGHAGSAVISITLGTVKSNSSAITENLNTIVKRTVSLAISRAVQSYVDKNSKGVGKVKITKSDIQGNWAMIWAEAVHQKLDPAQYLLHKEKGVWKVLVMGTSLEGTGEEYKVPSNLRKKWNL